ncbi:helix-turn-helix transcriptional regulator [Actinoplanes sp. TBRC 11911]|nr:helix-turn-helix transcriptional regulator [Actinoplanes sp. TBRC 11911]NMO51993.1 helix-turn-helix transcriptional regulator [Actinoplanes sp. TBRC 11911]
MSMMTTARESGTPQYVHDLVDALLTRPPVNFRGHKVPAEVAFRIRNRGARPAPGSPLSNLPHLPGLVVTAPDYVHDLLDALLLRRPLNLRGRTVPHDVLARLLPLRAHTPPAIAAPRQLPSPRTTVPAEPSSAPPARPRRGSSGGVVSDEQAAVLHGMADGLSNIDIAANAGTHLDAVKYASRTLFRKLQARDRAHAVAIAYRRGILTPEPPVAPMATRELTYREAQVLERMADGQQNADIGRDLYISEDTVKTYARRLFHTFGARNRAHAVALAFRTGRLS